VFIFWIILLPLIGHSQAEPVYLKLKDAKQIHPDSVFYLDLSREGLKEIPTEIIAFKNLKEIDLSNNKLTNLPLDFIFPELSILNLTNNKLHEFPSVICKNTGLTKLLMGKNYLTEIPECIGELYNLELLDIWFNIISILPESLTQLNKLRSIDIRGMNYSEEFQEKWNKLLPRTKIEFDNGCDCGL